MQSLRAVLLQAPRDAQPHATRCGTDGTHVPSASHSLFTCIFVVRLKEQCCFHFHLLFVRQPTFTSFNCARANLYHPPQGAHGASDGTAAPLSVAGNSGNCCAWHLTCAHPTLAVGIKGAMDLHTLSRSNEIRLKKKIKVGMLLCVHLQYVVPDSRVWP